MYSRFPGLERYLFTGERYVKQRIVSAEDVDLAPVCPQKLVAGGFWALDVP